MTNVIQATFPGAPKGLNVSVAPHEVDDLEAVMLQDVLLNTPGELPRRGPLTPVSGMVAFTDFVFGVVQCVDPTGVNHVGVIHAANGSNQAYLGVLSANYSSKTDIPFNIDNTLNLPTVYPVVDAKPGCLGGVWIGLMTGDYTTAASQQLAFWYGGSKADYGTGTLSCTLGSRIVTGAGTSWAANLSPGMFLRRAAGGGTGPILIGTIASVDSNTQVTLVDPSQWVLAGASYLATSIRGFYPRVRTGLITCDTTSAVVTGADTKFIRQGLTNTFQIFRASDNAAVGQVSSVANDTGLTLTTNAGVSMNEEPYIALDFATPDNGLVRAGGSQSIGFLNATWNSTQWFANGPHTTTVPVVSGRVWLATPEDMEAVDFSPKDGSYIDIPTSDGTHTPIKALVPTYHGLVVLKDKEAFVITGSSPADYAAHKIADDGVLSGMSAVQAAGGAVWAGRDGIWFYDGTSAVSVSEDNLGDAWRTAVKAFGTNTSDRMWATIYRNHYILYVNSVTASSSFSMNRNSVVTTPTDLTFSMFLPTKAVSLFSNFHLRGATTLPANAGGEQFFVANTSTIGKVCQMSTVFDGPQGADVFICDGGATGPNYFIQSKQYSLGDAMRRKSLHQVMLHYWCATNPLNVDTVASLNLDHSTFTVQAAGFWRTSRFLCAVRDRFLGVAIYADSTAPVVNVALWTLGYRPMRVGRL